MKRSEVGKKKDDLTDKLQASLKPERTPDGHVNNCAVFNGEKESTCQVCKGRCPDRDDAFMLMDAHLLAKVEEEVDKGADIKAPWDRRREAEAELESIIHEVNLSPGMERIVETYFEVADSKKEHDELVRALQLGEGHTDRGAIRQALDAAQDRARRAHRLYCAACIERARYTIDAEVVMAAMRAQAHQELEDEKATGDRKKAITDTDVRDKVAASHPKEVRDLGVREVAVRCLEDDLKNLSRLWSSRVSSLEAMLASSR